MKISGFTLVSAIFIVVILSLIGTYIVSISALTRSSSVLGIQGVRAYYAAKSGIEWLKTQVTSGSFNCPNPNPTILSLTQGGLSGFVVTVNCRANSYTEAGINYKVFSLSAQSQYSNSNNPDYSSRILYASVIQPGV